MAEEAGKILELMSMPDVSTRYSEIRKMQPGQLVKQLESKGVSIRGEMSELRGRLLRLEVRRAHPNIDTPWYLEDEVFMKKTDDFSKIDAETRWQLREASMDAEADATLNKCAWYKQMDDDDFSKKEKQALVDEESISLSTSIIADGGASMDTKKHDEKQKKIGIIFSLISFLLTCCCEAIKDIHFPFGMKTVLSSTFDVLQLSLYMWFLDSYIFYNKGFHIYVVVYWVIISLYSLHEHKHTIYVYVHKYPMEHQTRLLVHSLVRVMVVTFSFTCINSFIWFDNVMLTFFIFINAVIELCILIKEINIYESRKCAPKYFIYSEEK